VGKSRKINGFRIIGQSIKLYKVGFKILGMFLKLEEVYFKGFRLYAGVPKEDGIGIYIAKRSVVKSPYMSIHVYFTFGNDTQSDSLKQTLQFSENSEYPGFENKV
jgi:hypothetical protein